MHESECACLGYPNDTLGTSQGPKIDRKHSFEEKAHMSVQNFFSSVFVNIYKQKKDFSLHFINLAL